MNFNVDSREGKLLYAAILILISEEREEIMKDVNKDNLMQVLEGMIERLEAGDGSII